MSIKSVSRTIFSGFFFADIMSGFFKNSTDHYNNKLSQNNSNNFTKLRYRYSEEHLLSHNSCCRYWQKYNTTLFENRSMRVWIWRRVGDLQKEESVNPKGTTIIVVSSDL